MFEIKDEIRQIAHIIHQHGGRMFICGGACRDFFMAKAPMDFDFMVCGISQRKTMQIVDGFGSIKVADAISNAPVFIAEIDGESFEFAMARKEVSTVPGKHGFDFESGVHISPLDDLQRRDFTIGAILFDIISGRWADPFQGIQDIFNGVIRHVNSATFVQSPERVFRAAAQSARFGFTVHVETIELMGRMIVDAGTIPAEQIWRHIEKVGKGAIRPENFVAVLVACGWIKLFPEIHVADALFAASFMKVQSVDHFVATLIAGMSFEEEQSFFDKICCPKQIAKKAVEIKHFGVDGKPAKWVEGRDIAHIFDPGESMGKAVKWAFIGQINNIFADKEDAVEWIESNKGVF